MKHKGLLFILIVSLLALTKANGQRNQRQADAATKDWRYDIECVNTGKQGFKLIKIWSYAKKPKLAVSQSWKNAVHGIIFKGFSGTGRSCTGFRPLMNKAMTEKQYKEFFKEFFMDGGDYNQYVTDAADGLIDPRDVLKVNKKLYKIGIVVNVHTDALRKRLEQEGFISALSDGF
ncbi:Hypothetical protein I595_3077 [Croceitalea dokdonensis DOKDO 023]|uniref:Uncharacterized protein n=1 Tax=Croceitalea dokdonensis DOKDO 023 TaxID=1300341 RepID=A0A0P7AZR3_9FLAO|nr:hypothetical protein [Croceitalea dokdonensis]KPM31098.1 Hypothetical protein I595_3077 [Croceitalea dokdonensis DOKDO 023]